MTVSNNPPVISVRDLVVGFGAATVLNGASIEVFEGEVLGFVGGSGAGKSVLMRAIIGLLPKRQGKVEVFGSDLDTLNGRQRRAIEQRWGVLFQQGALFSSLTALQNVQFPMREYLRLSPRLMDEIALAKLEMVGLRADVRSKYPAELSGGMIKRVALARALALDPVHCLSRRAHIGARPDRRRRLRRAHSHAAADFGAQRLHGHPRPRQPARGVRPHRRAFRRARDRDRADRGDACFQTSVASILFRRQTRAASAAAYRERHAALEWDWTHEGRETERRERRWKPGLATSSPARSRSRSSPPCSASSFGCRTPATAASARSTA
jgi:ABC-type lipoprotein export system ATPase subunit